ncbi:Trp operon leader peptide [Vibrio galatheae]|uniref:Trp operon leader peptide n=1 Tax=Vibrio galatheae TaxID=579748 RepID=A0A0F4NPP7_9VIBR|nr:trp operon leader peptide [Vibrio galatheae]KJY84869.1 Trp operon leader peptide [Vibrio galatheae]
MLQDINQNHKAKVVGGDSNYRSADLAWWRTWTSSWWANVYF